MYSGQVTVSQSKLPSFLKTAQSLQIRGLANAGHKQQEQQPEDVLNTSSESHIPLRKRRRNLSSDVTINPKDPFCPSGEGPTDLSLPKFEANVSFQPVIQAVSYSTVDNANQPSKIYLKPKEALISPPASDTSDNYSDKSISDHVLLWPIQSIYSYEWPHFNLFFICCRRDFWDLD